MHVHGVTTCMINVYIQTVCVHTCNFACVCGIQNVKFTVPWCEMWAEVNEHYLQCHGMSA